MTLRFGAGATTRAISRELGISHSTVREYLARIAAAGIIWPLPAELSDRELEQRLFVNGGVRAGARHHVEPDWAAVARELKRPGVNLMILWEEYRAVHPDGYAYSRYCQLFREFERRLSPSMRQHHVAGDKAFVDFSGKKIPITDPMTGAVREAEIFVAVLGASNLTYAEATWTQGLSDWVGAHVRMFRFWGASPRLLVPDNLKSGVHKASFYDPEVNRSYGAMATHYGVGILPARPYHPKDKAKVEAGVRIAQFYLLGRLRNLTSFSLAEWQCSDHRHSGAVEWAGDVPPRGQPAGAVRDGRTPGDATAARYRLRVRRMGVCQGWYRLSHRGRRVLLLRPAHPNPPTG
jgi:transposase